MRQKKWGLLQRELLQADRHVQGARKPCRTPVCRLSVSEDSMEVFDEKKLESSLRKLAAWKRIAFMAQVGARMLPNFQHFSAETGFGDASVLKMAFDAAWTWIESEELPHNLNALREACEHQAPNTEQFSSPYTSAALDAANAAAATLDAIEHPDRARPTEVAALARDTVDIFVQDLIHADPNAPGFEEGILRHELMQRELRRQREDLEALTRWSNDRQTIGRELRAKFMAGVSGSLDE
jgi:uncharacterized protein